MSLKLTQEQVIEGIKKVHGDRYNLSQVIYIKAISPIKLICKEHGEFNVSYNKIASQNAGCPACGKLSAASKRVLNEDDVVNSIKEIHGDTLDLSKFVYSGMKSNSTVICREHGELQMTPNSLIYGKCGCKHCGMDSSNSAKFLTLEEVLTKSKEVHSNRFTYTEVKDYTDTKQLQTITCPVHGDFKQSFSNHLAGRGCNKCGRDATADAKRNDAEEIYELLRKREVESGYKTVEGFEYKTVNAKVDIICEKHGVFTPLLLNYLYKKTGCPKCATKVSKDEQEIIDFIKSNDVEVIEGSRTILKSKRELDIFIPSKNIAIEFNGLYYHSDKYSYPEYHIEKTKECDELGIKLIHIFEDEWKLNKEVVKSRLLNMLGKTATKIYARNTVVKELTAKKAKEFLIDNHIQGNCLSAIKLGLFLEDELVSIMIFGSLRKNLGQKSEEGHYELLRFCNKINTNVVGGASKLLSHFNKNYNPLQIISYADRRWSDGGLYEKLNFTFDKYTDINYFYTKGNMRENRFAYRKDVLVKEGFDKSKTEKEIMKERGFSRIYDCGALKYILNK